MASGKRKPPSKAGRRHARTASQDDQFKKHCANKENHIPPSPPPLNRITRSQAAGIGRKVCCYLMLLRLRLWSIQFTDSRIYNTSSITSSIHHYIIKLRIRQSEDHLTRGSKYSTQPWNHWSGATASFSTVDSFRAQETYLQAPVRTRHLARQVPDSSTTESWSLSRTPCYPSPPPAKQRIRPQITAQIG